MTKKNNRVGAGKTVAELQKKQQKHNHLRTAKPPMLRAMVWYKEEHYQSLRKLFIDAELLPKTYDDWLLRAEEKKTEVEATGDQVIKVFIDPEIFPLWCKEKNLVMDASARSQLALEVAQAQSFTL